MLDFAGSNERGIAFAHRVYTLTIEDRQQFQIAPERVFPTRNTVLPNPGHGFFIVTEASLSFLGLGIQPPTPAWGSMVADGRNFLLNAWWVSTFPGLASVILVLCINLFGEAMRDILDPKLKIE